MFSLANAVTYAAGVATPLLVKAIFIAVGYLAKRKIERLPEHDSLDIHGKRLDNDAKQLDNLKRFLEVLAKAKEQNTPLALVIDGYCIDFASIVERLAKLTEMVLAAKMQGALGLEIVSKNPETCKERLEMARQAFLTAYQSYCDVLKTKGLVLDPEIERAMIAYSNHVLNPTEINAEALLAVGEPYIKK